MFCNVVAPNGKVWNILFLYRELVHHLRHLLWDELHFLLAPYDNYLIIGNINQVDNYSDKLGGDTMIRGCEEFTNWKHSVNLKDIRSGSSMHVCVVYIYFNIGLRNGSLIVVSFRELTGALCLNNYPPLVLTSPPFTMSICRIRVKCLPSH